MSTAQVKYLPGLQVDGLSRIYAAHLDALSEPPDDPVGPGGVEYIGEVLTSLALEVIQVPLTGEDLILAALVMKPSLGHLLGVD